MACRAAWRLAAGGAHQALDVVATHREAIALERHPRAPVPGAVGVGRMPTLDLRQQPLVRHGAPGAPSGGALVVRGRRRAQGPADRLDAEAAAVLIDETAHLGRSASSSVAKNTDAALRISFARRSS